MNDIVDAVRYATQTASRPKRIDILKTVVTYVRANRGTFRQMSAETGVSIATLQKISRNDESLKIRVDVAQKIFDHKAAATERMLKEGIDVEGIF